MSRLCGSTQLVFVDRLSPRQPDSTWKKEDRVGDEVGTTWYNRVLRNQGLSWRRSLKTSKTDATTI